MITLVLVPSFYLIVEDLRSLLGGESATDNQRVTKPTAVTCDSALRDGGLIAGLLVCAVLALAAPAVGADRPSAAVTQIAQAPVIDGEIGDDEWSGVAVVDQPFTQFEPDVGRPSSFRTTIRIAQTTTALYVAVKAIDPQPERIASAVTRRDGPMHHDDAVVVLLDTFSDQRTAYAFFTNTLATQWDARIADNGRTVDELWDAEWRCAARRHDDGWSVEFEIPFAVLRFRSGEDQTWGLNVGRTVPRRLEVSLWGGPSEDVWRVSSSGTLTGLRL